MSSRAVACVQKLGLKGVSVGMGGRRGVAGDDTALIPVPGLERAFPDGLSASLHLMEAASTKDAASLSAVALALLRHAPALKTVVWITERLAASEAGAPYGPGLSEYGHDPARFLFVEARRSVDALWAMEEALRSRAVSAVVAELHNERALDLTATRRLALRSERAAAPALIVSHMRLGEAALAARSRWYIRAAPSRSASDHDSLIGRPTVDVEITKNRDGPCPHLRLALDLATGAFREVPRRADRRAPRPPVPVTAAGGPDEAARQLIAPAVVRLAAERRARAQAARMRS